MNKMKLIAAVVVVLAAVAGLYVSALKPQALGPVAEPVVKSTETAPVETKATAPKLADNRVYVMYVKSCPMCAKALEYINGKYADNETLELVNLDTAEGKELLKACREKFGFKDIVIPLICTKDEYKMGWSQAMSVRLDGFVQKAAE